MLRPAISRQAWGFNFTLTPIIQQNQLALGEKQQKSVFRSDLIGQVFGLIVCLSSIAAAIYLGITAMIG